MSGAPPLLLDACAVISWLSPHEETERSKDFLDDLFLNCHRPDRSGLAILTHNLAEVIVTRQRVDQDARAGASLPGQLEALGVDVVDAPSAALARLVDVAAAEWRLEAYPKQKLSLGDRLLVATALHLRRPVVTSDQLWFGLPRTGLALELVDYRDPPVTAEEPVGDES